MPTVRSSFMRAVTIPCSALSHLSIRNGLIVSLWATYSRQYSNSALQASKASRRSGHKRLKLVHNDTASQLATSTVLVPHPAQMERSRVIKGLPRLMFPFHGTLRSLTFLVTPEFVPWFQEDSSFIQDVLDHMYQDWEVGSKTTGSSAEPGAKPQLFTVQSRVVAVDRIPFLSGFGSGAPGISLAATRYARNWFNETGLKRMAKTKANTPMIIVKHTFNGDDAAAANPRIVLRPANTLFVNGRDATMFMDEWVLDAEAVSRHKFVRGSKREQITHISFNHKPQDSSMTAPLQRLTESREILTCMGNILSKLVEKNSPEPVSASRELEEKVSAYMNQKYTSNGSLAVFALITPKPGDRTDSVLGPDVAAGLFGQTSSEGTERINSEGQYDLDGLKLAMSRGAHLHRVTSGGGGWGQKRGLLSLDPAFGFEGDGAVGNSSEETIVASEQVATQVARPGDHVEFFVTSTSKEAEQAVNRKESLKSAIAHRDTENWPPSFWAEQDQNNIVWGVVPSDDGVGGGPSHVLTEDLITVPHHFGMLSENGLALQRWERKINEDLPARLRVQGEHVTSITKIDAPYTVLRYNIANRKASKPQGSPDGHQATEGGEHGNPTTRPASVASHKIGTRRPQNRERKWAAGRSGGPTVKDQNRGSGKVIGNPVPSPEKQETNRDRRSLLERKFRFVTGLKIKKYICGR